MIRYFLLSFFLIASQAEGALQCTSFVDSQNLWKTQDPILQITNAIRSEELKVKFKGLLEELGLKAGEKLTFKTRAWVWPRSFSQVEALNRFVTELYWRRIKGVSVLQGQLKSTLRESVVEALLVQIDVYEYYARTPYDQKTLGNLRRFIAMAYNGSLVSKGELNFNLLTLETYRKSGEAGVRSMREDFPIHRFGTWEYVLRAWHAFERKVALRLLAGAVILLLPDMVQTGWHQYSLHYSGESTAYIREAGDLYRRDAEEIRALIRKQIPNREASDLDRALMDMILRETQ